METDDYSSHMKVAGVGIVITLVCTGLVLLHYLRISGRTGTIVIPAGNTYLGPAAAKPADQPPSEQSEPTLYHGRVYGYSFSAPQSVKLTALSDDTYDMYAVALPGTDPGSNVLIGLDPKADPKQNKRTYVQNWWKQFSGLKSIAGLEQFTNSRGLKGYKAKFVNTAGETPNLDVFFEVPKHPTYVIHLASGSLDPSVFEAIVNSVDWENK
ncbi:hypothetical protein A2363_01630 [Candidatus Gottesmanbacteria bacterium RIFOXYB1_FULL_47_11]|uniref:Uncharacterized protein n=1 Tax=Candidatus Gottesmanbacteria bacterium RIFOXYB1_FULL_47_11 TaxID=1798401 RepID=A0A1F6BG61_9BACT|nr:MAG: hypothetical protein A2363_01630 [Candidatus Gottesmanbacteria bacterium RIFOXYB1_FULL_47_11]